MLRFPDVDFSEGADVILYGLPDADILKIRWEDNDDADAVVVFCRHFRGCGGASKMAITRQRRT